MKNYPIDELVSGMIIAEEIVLFDGLVVIKAGIELDETIIEVLKKQNLDLIVIQEPIDHNKTYSDEEIQQMKLNIEEHKKILFQDCLEDEYMSELYKAVCDLRLLESMDG